MTQRRPSDAKGGKIEAKRRKKKEDRSSEVGQVQKEGKEKLRAQKEGR